MDPLMYLKQELERVLVSPAYPEGSSMRFRIVNGDLVRYMRPDATHWQRLKGPAESVGAEEPQQEALGAA